MGRTSPSPPRCFGRPAGEIGAVRLQPFVPELLDRLLAFGALPLTALRRVSAATLKRLLAPIRATRPPRGRGTTRAGTWLKHQIPIRTFAEWDDARPGFLEGDFVAHCGPTTAGFYLYTLCAVDIVTAWAELHAVWGKHQERVGGAIHHVRQRLRDVVISVGVNIYAAEILHRPPSSKTSRPSASPARGWGEGIHAAVQVRPGVTITAEDVIGFARERLAGYKVPREVSFHVSLPRDPAGKLLERVFRDPYWAGWPTRV